MFLVATELIFCDVIDIHDTSDEFYAMSIMPRILYKMLRFKRYSNYK
jgi:hypothetical protein